MGGGGEGYSLSVILHAQSVYIIRSGLNQLFRLLEVV